MKVIAPKYFSQFKCLASNCSHSCCIGWEIDVDDKTLSKYENSKVSYARKICKSIDKKDTPHFTLLPNGNCPHLDESGLCKIITNMGEDYLCDICREHPRFYNQTPYGLEVGLGLSCEEACRIILTSNDFHIFEEIDDNDVALDEFVFDPIPFRNSILNIIATNNLSYSEKLQAIKNIISNQILFNSDENWQDLINSFEYLDDSHKELFSHFSTVTSPSKDNQIYLERILAYFVYRYVCKAQNQNEIHQYLGLCLFLENLVCSVLNHKGANTLKEIIPLVITISEEIEYSEDNIDAILFELI
jgi:lysine-N-methylase